MHTHTYTHSRTNKYSHAHTHTHSLTHLEAQPPVALNHVNVGANFEIIQCKELHVVLANAHNLATEYV